MGLPSYLGVLKASWLQEKRAVLPLVPWLRKRASSYGRIFSSLLIFIFLSFSHFFMVIPLQDKDFDMTSYPLGCFKNIHFYYNGETETQLIKVKTNTQLSFKCLSNVIRILFGIHYTVLHSIRIPPLHSPVQRGMELWICTKP